MEKTGTLKNIILLFVFISFLFLLRWNSISAPFERDEGEYAYSAWILKEGGVPYKDSFLQKPPLIVYTYYLGQLFSPLGLWPPRVLAFIFVVIESGIIFLWLRKMVGYISAWMGVFLFALFVSSPVNASLAANTEVFMLLPYTLLLYLSGKEDKFNGKQSFISGILSAFSIMYKPICLYPILFVFLYRYLKYLKNKKYKYLLLDGILVISGFLITSSLILLPIALKGGIGAFWEQVIVFNYHYSRHWGYSLTPMILNLKTMLGSFWPLYLLVVLYLFSKQKDKTYLVGIFFFSLFAVFQTTIRHYYLLLIPVVTVMSVSSIDYISKKMFKERHYIYKIYMGLGIILICLIPIMKQFGLSPGDYILWVYGDNNPFYESRFVADKISEITEEEDKIFVAGSEPQIYYYSRRKASNRYVITYPLLINTPRKEDYQQEVLDSLYNNPPKILVYSLREQSGLVNHKDISDEFMNSLEDLIASNYKIVGGYIWDQKYGRWKDDVNDLDIDKTSIILYELTNE